MFHTLSVDETVRKLDTNISKGLTSKEVIKRQKLYGLNK